MKPLTPLQVASLKLAISYLKPNIFSVQTIEILTNTFKRMDEVVTHEEVMTVLYGIRAELENIDIDSLGIES